jgi:hypothetical protein
MAQRTLHDGSIGDVVIRSGPPAAGGGGGSVGGFGGNRVGASGNFGGPSARTKALRRQAKLEHAARQAKEQAQAVVRAQVAQEQARLQTRQQQLEGMVQRQSAFRVEADRSFAARTEQLASSLDSEVLAVRRPPAINPSERWQLYLITKEKIEIDGLIARKTAEFSTQDSLARSFDGYDPLVRSTSDYKARLDQFGDVLNSGHQAWEAAYNAAHEAQLLSAQIKALTERSATLSGHHAEQTIVWREREALWERHRQVAEQRDARVRFKQQADADVRIERVKQANTYRFAVNPSMAAVSALAIPGGASVAGAADALAVAVTRSVELLGEVAATLTARQVVMFTGGMLYTSKLGNAELTPEQRARLFHAVAVPAHTLELHDSLELQAIADAGGSAEVEYRLKPVAEAQGAAIIVASTGVEIDSWVPVVNAVLDPLTGVYTAEVPGSPTRYVEFAPDTAPQAQVPNPQPLAVTQPQILGIPAGVDWRIQDCIVCVPGLEPIYLSFNTPPMGAGVVTGTGQPVTNDWWKATTQPVGAAIPTLIGDQFRGREFTSFEAFDEAFWRTLGEHHEIVSQFDEVNQKRLEQGYAPYAPKSTWAGENREFELRYQERPGFWSDPFNLDQISIKTPSSVEGWIGAAPAVVPWPIPPANTWKPLVPPGSELLGSTISPIPPVVPGIYPGSPDVPVLPEKETYPAVDEGELGASVPGFPGDMELPSPDVLFLDRRDDPGVAIGVGQAVSGIWLGDATRGEGAPVPLQIADQLRGKEFANFHRFREAFWRAVAADSTLRAQFNSSNLRFMRKGRAPFPRASDKYGGRVKFELHHQLEVGKGGAVYDMENIVVMTPERHVFVHKGKNQL